MTRIYGATTSFRDDVMNACHAYQSVDFVKCHDEFCLSNCTSMFCAGDEFMTTQLRSDNPYNQDSELTWLNWVLLAKNSGIFRFFKQMFAFRKAHPSIARSHVWRQDVHWHETRQTPDLATYSHTLPHCLHGG
jgi:glycogen operon protein